MIVLSIFFVVEYTVSLTKRLDLSSGNVTYFKSGYCKTQNIYSYLHKAGNSYLKHTFFRCNCGLVRLLLGLKWGVVSTYMYVSMHRSAAVSGKVERLSAPKNWLLARSEFLSQPRWAVRRRACQSRLESAECDRIESAKLHGMSFGTRVSDSGREREANDFEKVY